MQRADSGNHWSQQMPTPIVPCCRVPHPEPGVARARSSTSRCSRARRGCGSCGRCRAREPSASTTTTVLNSAWPARSYTLSGSTTPSSAATAAKCSIVGWPSSSPGPAEMLGQLVLAEVRPLEQFGDQDDPSLPGRRHRGPAARRWRRCRRSRRSSPSGRGDATRSAIDANGSDEREPARRRRPVACHSSVRASVDRHADSRRSSRSVARSRSNAATADDEDVEQRQRPDVAVERPRRVGADDEGVIGHRRERRQHAVGQRDDPRPAVARDAAGCRRPSGRTGGCRSPRSSAAPIAGERQRRA